MKKLMFILLLFILYSCSSVKQVPSLSDFSEYPYGALIRTESNSSYGAVGELIAIDGKDLIYLNSKGKIKKVGKHLTKRVKALLTHTYDLDSMKKKNAIGLMSIGHGWLGFITGIINGVVISAVSKSVYYVEFEGDIEWDRINMFARFPQGLPENVTLSDLETKK